MAEINIEKKSNPWPWIIGLIVLALLAWAAIAMFNADDRVGDAAYRGYDTEAEVVDPAVAAVDVPAADNVAAADIGTAAGASGATRVYFPLDQAELTADARGVLDEVAEQAKDEPGTEIVLAAYTDTTGTRPYNEALSERRGAAVRQYLVDQGVAAERITVEAHGQSEPLVETGDGVREQDNRRVRIEYGDES